MYRHTYTHTHTHQGYRYIWIHMGIYMYRHTLARARTHARTHAHTHTHRERRFRQAAGTLNMRTRRHKFCKVPFIVTSYSKYTKALSSHNFLNMRIRRSPSWHRSTNTTTPRAAPAPEQASRHKFWNVPDIYGYPDSKYTKGNPIKLFFFFENGHVW